MKFPRFVAPSLVYALALVLASAFAGLPWVDRSPLLAVQANLTEVPAEPLDPNEAPGERPYEIVQAAREPEPDPLVGFDSLDGWRLQLLEGARGNLSVSVAQRVWESPVARLRYRGESEASAVRLLPPEPIPVPPGSTAVTLWMHGNNWGWVPDPTTPQVGVVLLIEDASGKIHKLELTRVRWREWWLIHKVLPAEIRSEASLRLAGIEIAGCANTEERELFFENLVFLREAFAPLAFAPRPQVPLELFPGQSAGANTGPGRLPFPTREETILPDGGAESFSNGLRTEGGAFRFLYEGEDGVVEYLAVPGAEYWGPVEVRVDGATVARALAGAGPVFDPPSGAIRLVRAWEEADAARAVWEVETEEGRVDVESTMRILRKSLVVDFICRGGLAAELAYGRIIEEVRDSGQLVAIPYLNYGGHMLNVFASSRPLPFFASVWMDWYRSNGSRPYAVDEIDEDGVELNGGVRYLPRTDGVRNDLYERVFVTFAPRFEEVLPNIPNPPARRGKEAGSRLWQETWGPQDYAKEMERSRRLRAYGIDQLTQCNHEITWRDGGESFTFRTMAAPGKGGDPALREYVAAQKALGWRSGLYTNYTDYAPVSANWDIDMVMRDSGGDLVRAWPRCYSPKALFAVEADRFLAPRIQQKFGTDAAYTDVHTSVGPWDRVDYDARVPGAGSFAATFYAYGELLLHDQEVYDGFCWSEGHHQWLYAGLATGNYALTYTELDYREYPYLPHFDLLKMHPLTVDIGMPWTAFFFRKDEGWREPDRIEGSIDRFLAATLAYGHLGWLVEEAHGIRRTVRSYYMMQQLQSRYAMERPEVILYGAGDGRLRDSSSAILNGDWKRSQIYTRYANGLELWVNGNPSEDWAVEVRGVGHALPPFGWAAVHGDDFYEASSLSDGSRWDRVGSPEYVFLDGRGAVRSFEGVAAAGSVAVKRIPFDGSEAVEVIVVEGLHRLDLLDPGGVYGWDDVRTRLSRLARAEGVTLNAFDVDGNAVEAGSATRVSGAGWSIPIAEGAVRYVVTATGGRQLKITDSE
jgi:hypothetical protein